MLVSSRFCIFWFFFLRRAAIAATAIFLEKEVSIFTNWGIVSLTTDFLDIIDSEHFLEVIEIPEFEEYIQASIRGWELELHPAREEAEEERIGAYYETHGGWTESESD